MHSCPVCLCGPSVQCLEEPFPRIRVAMTAANAVGWVDVFSFYAFDVPVSGTQRYAVA